jgi:hypothetical protein
VVTRHVGVDDGLAAALTGGSLLLGRQLQIDRHLSTYITNTHVYRCNTIGATSADPNTVAVVTDIHGNLPALQAALARVEELGIERVFCGGDLVGYGPHPNEVCALISERDIPTIYRLCAAAHNA